MAARGLNLPTIALAVVLAACSGEESTPSGGDGSLRIPSGTYAVDRTHTYVTFSYLHQGLSYPLLRATAIDGELTLDSNELENSRVSIAIGADSIRTNTPHFDKELASPKFFNAAKFPHITFVTDRFDLETETQGALHGFVTIRGITRPLTLAAEINGAMENPITKTPVIGVSASGSLNRSEFELDRFIPAVGDEVNVAVEVEFALGSTETSAAAAKTAMQAHAASSAD
ncbi:MAG: YceI family protein [Pseudomonadota bacterium]